MHQDKLDDDTRGAEERKEDCLELRYGQMGRKPEVTISTRCVVSGTDLQAAGRS